MSIDVRRGTRRLCLLQMNTQEAAFSLTKFVGANERKVVRYTFPKSSSSHIQSATSTTRYGQHSQRGLLNSYTFLFHSVLLRLVTAQLCHRCSPSLPVWFALYWALPGSRRYRCPSVRSSDEHRQIARSLYIPCAARLLVMLRLVIPNTVDAAHNSCILLDASYWISPSLSRFTVHVYRQWLRYFMFVISCKVWCSGSTWKFGVRSIGF